jgi:hypothetical protein
MAAASGCHAARLVFRRVSVLIDYGRLACALPAVVLTDRFPVMCAWPGPRPSDNCLGSLRADVGELVVSGESGFDEQSRLGRWDGRFQASQVVPVSQVGGVNLHVYAVLAGQPLGGNSQPFLTLGVALPISPAADGRRVNASPRPRGPRRSQAQLDCSLHTAAAMLQACLLNGQSRRSGPPLMPGNGLRPVRSPLLVTSPPEPTHRWHQLRNQATPPHPPISCLRPQTRHIR